MKANRNQTNVNMNNYAFGGRVYSINKLWPLKLLVLVLE